MLQTKSVDTRKVKERRVLRFESLAAMVREAERLESAERAGTLRRLGNWELGQALNHMAVWAEFAYNGVPPEGHAPWFVRIPARLFFKNYFLSRTMMPGLRPVRSPAGTLGVEVVPTPQALARLRAATARLDAEAPVKPNSLLGPLTHDQWRALHLRHAELHLGFFIG